MIYFNPSCEINGSEVIIPIFKMKKLCSRRLWLVQGHMYNYVIPTLMFFLLCHGPLNQDGLHPQWDQLSTDKPLFPGPRELAALEPIWSQWMKLSVIGDGPHPPVHSIRSILSELLEARKALQYVSMP